VKDNRLCIQVGKSRIIVVCNLTLVPSLYLSVEGCLHLLYTVQFPLKVELFVFSCFPHSVALIATVSKYFSNMN